MNIITHENFESEIVYLHGRVFLNKFVKRFMFLRTKRVKLECGLIYVKKCNEVGVIPKFAQIKPIKCFRDHDSFFKKVNKDVCVRVVRDYYRKISLVSEELFRLHLHLAHILTPRLWNVLDAMSFIRSSKLRDQITCTHESKLERLIRSSKQPPMNNVSVELKTTVVNLSSQVLTDEMTRALAKGLNYAPTPHRLPIETIITSVEDTIARNKVPKHESDCFRQDVASLIRKAKLPKSNISRGEFLALRSLRRNPDLLVLPADKGNATVVIDTVAYETKITDLLSDTVTYKQVAYNPTARVVTKLQDLLRTLSDELYGSLRPTNPTTPKIYGLPKIHKENWPLRPIVSQIDSPTYKVAKYMAGVLQEFVGQSTSFVKNSTHFTQLLEDVVLDAGELMVSFDVTSLFTKVPITETISIIRNLCFSSTVPSEYMPVIEFVLTSGYFSWHGEYYLQLDGVAMGSPLAPVIANLFMEWFENDALTTAPGRPRYWWRYVDDVFAIIQEEQIEGLLEHLNSRHPNIAFTVERELDGELPFLDVLVKRDGFGHLSHTVYRKPTHTDRYLRADSHHHPSHLASIPRTLINRALKLCDHQYLDTELSHVRNVLSANGYGWKQSFRIAQPSSRKRPVTAERAVAYLPFVKGVTDKIGHLLRRRLEINTIFRPLTKIRDLLRSPKDRDPLSTPGVYEIPCDCGSSYVGETKRNISTRLTEHIRAMKNADVDKSAIAEHALTAGTSHYIRFDKARVLARERFFVPRKIREAIEINRTPNFNRDKGWAVPPAWLPCLHGLRVNKGPLPSSGDTISAVCYATQDVEDDSSDDEANVHSVPATTSVGMAHLQAPPVPPPPPLSSRALRYLARSESRARDLRGDGARRDAHSSC